MSEAQPNPEDRPGRALLMYLGVLLLGVLLFFWTAMSRHMGGVGLLVILAWFPLWQWALLLPIGLLLERTGMPRSANTLGLAAGVLTLVWGGFCGLPMLAR